MPKPWAVSEQEAAEWLCCPRHAWMRLGWCHFESECADAYRRVMDAISE